MTSRSKSDADHSVVDMPPDDNRFDSNASTKESLQFKSIPMSIPQQDGDQPVHGSIRRSEETMQHIGMRSISNSKDGVTNHEGYSPSAEGHSRSKQQSGEKSSSAATIHSAGELELTDHEWMRFYFKDISTNTTDNGREKECSLSNADDRDGRSFVNGSEGQHVDVESHGVQGADMDLLQGNGNEDDQNMHGQPEGDSSDDKWHRKFECTTDPESPRNTIRVITSSISTSWSFQANSGLYDVVLGISTDASLASKVESIVFTLKDMYNTSGRSEVITQAALRDQLVPSGEAIVPWKLHQAVRCECYSDEGDVYSMIMETRMSPGVSSDIDAAILTVHYMELRPTGQNVPGSDALLCVHRPYIWSINVNQVDRRMTEENWNKPLKIRRYAVSGSGSHIVTLTTRCDDQAFLDLWSMQDPYPASPGSDLISAGQQYGMREAEQPPFHPHHCASAPLGEIQYYYMVSLSWNASYIALTHDSMTDEELVIYGGYKDSGRVLGQSASVTRRLALSKDHKNAHGLDNFCGYGKFHTIATGGQDARDERFVTCSVDTVEFYSIDGKWTHLQSITLSLSLYGKEQRLMLESLRGRFFALRKQECNTTSIHDIVSGSVVLCVTGVDYINNAKYGFSSSGALMVVAEERLLRIFDTRSSLLLASRSCLEWYEGITNLQFIDHDSRILLETQGKNLHIGPATTGFILDASDLAIVDYILPPGQLTIQQPINSGSSQRLYALHESTLSLIRLEDCIVTPFLQPTCAEHCTQMLTTIDACFEFTSPSGLHFRMQPLGYSSRSIDVYVTDGQQPPQEKFNLEVESHSTRAAFLKSRERLIVIMGQRIMVWVLPTTMDSDFILVAVWDGRGVGDFPWLVCEHQHLYIRQKNNSPAVQLRDDKPGRQGDAELFIGGVEWLQRLYNCNSGISGDAIAQYLCDHINDYPDADPRVSTLYAIYNKWDLNFGCNKRCIPLLLESWVPRKGLSMESTPLWLLLKATHSDPKCSQVAMMAIDHCIRQARATGERAYLRPILRCLHELLDQSKPHARLAATTLRLLAYVPVGDRRFIINNHTIAHPPDFRWRFWRADERRLFNSRNPILQVANNPECRNPSNENFTRELFVAPIEMLWWINDGYITLNAPSKLPHQGFPWMYWLLQMAGHKVNFLVTRAIECHDFTLESLDNPAIEALIEFKWNTIGYKSIYNMVDIATFGFPLAGSIYQLLVIYGAVDKGTNTTLFSFSVLFIFLHFLFELRVNGTICQFVTIIIQILSKIRVFFFIFAGGIIAFTIANGGRYDPISDDLGTNTNWGLITMMIVFFFFTVILMLNVLIALINVAFTQGDETWRLVWFKNRLSYVARAEDMSYHLSGAREAHNWFPSEIYYSATPEQVENYKKKYSIIWCDEDKTKVQSNVRDSRQDQEDQGTHQEDLQRLQQNGDELRKKIEEELQQFREEISNLRGQLRDQQEDAKTELLQSREEFNSLQGLLRDQMKEQSELLRSIAAALSVTKA
ncbi:hypothetical protein BGX24_003611 [Mortierella sp. AD032]|nr:hypothetical protein BGX24_003611 [Mortierella sp. AD032]